jgi:hypothetical protein
MRMQADCRRSREPSRRLAHIRSRPVTDQAARDAAELEFPRTVGWIT